MYQDYNNIYNRRYGYPYYRREKTVVDEEIISLSEALDLIRKSIADEKQDELFYNALIEKAPDDNAKNIIVDIRDDEKKHNEILRFIYSNITGEVFNDINNNENKINEETTYAQDLENALFGELDAVKKYRKIMGAMPSSKMQTLIMSILTDELRHANKYNYLIHKAHA